MTMHNERLLKLASFLDTVPEPLFNLSTYMSFEDNPNIDGLKNLDTECGTTACAIGFFPLVFPDNFKYRHVDAIGDGCEVSSIMNVHYNEIKEFLDINDDEYAFLFQDYKYPHNSRRASDVAARIRQFVQDGQTSEEFFW